MFDFLKSLFKPGQKNSLLKEKISSGALLVDVRTPAEFNAGHVRGSVNIPLDQLLHNLSRFERKKNIIVFCRSGNRSELARSILINNGFNNVMNGQSWKRIAKLI